VLRTSLAPPSQAMTGAAPPHVAVHHPRHLAMDSSVRTASALISSTWYCRTTQLTYTDELDDT
jgi:hypothetical protein